MIKKILYEIKNGTLFSAVVRHFKLKKALKFKGSDEQYLCNLSKTLLNYTFDLNNPTTFQEKLNWLKLHNKKEFYTELVDKYSVKIRVSELIGDKYIIPTLGVYKTPDEIDFDKLPNQFVIKTTHDSGGVIICRDKSNFDVKKAKRLLRKYLKRKFSNMYLEYPYEGVEPKIIIEKYMSDNDDSNELTDYKFFCFDGYVDCVMLCKERSSGHPKFYFFDKNKKFLKLTTCDFDLPDDFTLDFSSKFSEMFDIASKLSKGFPFIRVDLYCSNDNIYFGEYTFFPDAGFDSTLTPKCEKRFGDLIKL